MITFKSKNGRLGEIMYLIYGLFYFCIDNDLPLDRIFVDEDYVGTDFYGDDFRYVVRENFPIFANIRKYIRKIEKPSRFYSGFRVVDYHNHGKGIDIVSDDYFLDNYWHTPYDAQLFRLLFRPKSLFDEIKRKYDPLYRFDSAWSCHIRRGDFVMIEQSRLLSGQYEGKVPAKPEDIEVKLRLLPEGQRAVVFSDDIEWCRGRFGHLDNVVFSECGAAYEDMACISMCRRHICLSNSYFNICAMMLAGDYNGKLW